MTDTDNQEQNDILTETATTATETVKRTTRFKYSWVVLIASFLTLFLNASIGYAAGVFHVALLDRFPDDVKLTPWLGSLYSSMFALGAPVASLMTNVFNCRTCGFASGILGLVGYGASAFVTDLRLLFLTYALTAGLGAAFAQVSSIVALGYYFPHDTALVSGITLCGAGLGIFVHPPLVQLFIDWYGLTGTFLLTGAMAFHCCIFGLLMRPSSKEAFQKSKLKSGRTRSERILVSLLGGSVGNTKVFMQFSFWMFLVSSLLHSMGYCVQLLLIPDYMEKIHGTPRHEASLVISFIGVGSLISRISVGALANDKRVGPEIAYFSIIGITGILSLFVPFLAPTTGGRYTYGLLLGLYTGGVFPSQSAIALQINGPENFALTYGTVLLFLGVGSLTGPPTAGLIHKATTNYNYVFLCSSAMFFMSMVSGVLIPLGRKRKATTNNALKEENSQEMTVKLKLLSESNKT